MKKMRVVCLMHANLVPPDDVSGFDVTTVAKTGAPVIAVLAFNNLSTDPSQEYFSDGIAEDILTDLSKLTELRVIARNSSFTYKGKPVDLKRVGRELGARYVLEGSVRRVGDRIRVTSQLCDAADDVQVWTERYDRDLTDIFMVQDELTLNIIRALRIHLSPEKHQQLTRRSDVSIEAHNLFLRGLEQAYKTTAEDNSVARQLLAQAIELSPAFASAHAFVAFTHIDDYIMGCTEHPEKSLEFDVAIARHAYEFEPDNPDVLALMSMAMQWSRHPRQKARSASVHGAYPSIAPLLHGACTALHRLCTSHLTPGPAGRFPASASPWVITSCVSAGRESLRRAPRGRPPARLR